MTEGESWPRALFGGRLDGHAPVRYVYLDEAGTSAKEPVTVVAALIVHADMHWRLVENTLWKLFNVGVPPSFREGFVFHAKSVWGDKKFRDVWGMEQRIAFLCAVMSLPRRLGIPISFAIRRRGAIPVEWFGITDEIRQEEMEHLMAFSDCIARVDKYLRDYTPSNEVATLIAEDSPLNKEAIRKVYRAMRDKPMRAPAWMFKRTEGHKEQDVVFEISKIVDGIHFASKADGPLLQVADACVFGLRRYFAEQSFGDKFLQAILGTELVKEDWAGGASASTYFWHPKMT